MHRQLTLFIFLALLHTQLGNAQTPYHELAKDTIITQRMLLGNVYLLDGKKMNLEVMEWFMLDHPAAHDNIQVALISDQVAAVSYTMGTLSLLTGYLISQESQAAGRDLIFLGGGGIGIGLLCSILSGAYRKRAVSLYNWDIRKDYFNVPKVGLSVELIPGGLCLSGKW
jgi:hypothetical protein